MKQYKGTKIRAMNREEQVCNYFYLYVPSVRSYIEFIFLEHHPPSIGQLVKVLKPHLKQLMASDRYRSKLIDENNKKRDIERAKI